MSGYMTEGDIPRFGTKAHEAVERMETAKPRKLTHGTLLPAPKPEPKQEVRRVPNRTMRRKSGWRKTAKQGYRKRHAAQQDKGESPWRLRGDATGNAEGSTND